MLHAKSVIPHESHSAVFSNEDSQSISLRKSSSSCSNSQSIFTTSLISIRLLYHGSDIKSSTLILQLCYELRIIVYNIQTNEYTTIKKNILL
ncbi:hypothetical protein [Lactococcus phage PMBT68]|nr:hypothetical protein [Lactococcus phage P1411]